MALLSPGVQEMPINIVAIQEGELVPNGRA